MNTVKAYLEQVKAEAVERVIQRTITELPDYAKRDRQELRSAVERAYIGFCQAIFTNDFDTFLANTRKAVEANMARKIDPKQGARTALILPEIVEDMLKQAGTRVDTEEREQFNRAASRLTKLDTTYSHALQARVIVENATSSYKQTTKPDTSEK